MCSEVLTETAEEGGKNEQQMRETEEKPGKEDPRLRSERRNGPFPRREGSIPPRVGTGSVRGETEERGKGFWDAEELDPHQTRGWCTRIAGQPLGPREPRMGALCPGKDRWRRDLLGLVGLRKYHLDSLVAHELHAGAPMRSPTPIPPEQGGRAHRERMQQQTHPAGLCRLVAVPLTLLGACGHGRQSRILAA